MAASMAVLPVQCDSHAVLPPVQTIVERIPLESAARSGITVVQCGKPWGVRNFAMARFIYATYGAELDPTYDHTSPQFETFDVEVIEGGIAHRLRAKEERHRYGVQLLDTLLKEAVLRDNLLLVKKYQLLQHKYSRALELHVW